MASNQQFNITITTGTIIKAAAVIIGIFLLYLLRQIVLVLLTAVVIASAIEPAIRWFGRWGIKRLPAVIIIYLLIALALAAALIFFVPIVIDEIGRASAGLPDYIEAFRLPKIFPSETTTTTPAFAGFGESLSLEKIIGDIQGVLAKLSQGFFQAAAFIFGGVLSFVLIIVFSFYLAVQEGGISSFLRVVIPANYENYALDLWQRSKYKIGRWLQGQVLLGVLISVLVFLGLTVLGIPNALLLALLAGLMEIIPVFGPIIAAVPAVLIGFSQSLTSGLMVLGFYIIIQQFENHLIYPLVVTKIVGVPPLLVILALIVGATLAGFLGILLAVPVAAVIMELYYDLDARKARIEHQLTVNKSA